MLKQFQRIYLRMFSWHPQTTTICIYLMNYMLQRYIPELRMSNKNEVNYFSQAEVVTTDMLLPYNSGFNNNKHVYHFLSRRLSTHCLEPSMHWHCTWCHWENQTTSRYAFLFFPELFSLLYMCSLLSAINPDTVQTTSTCNNKI